MNHDRWMIEALGEAMKGTGHVSPNPRVGCVIVENDSIVAQGHHARYGDVHAEVAALRTYSGNPEEATMYVTLEPCSHQGKQGPCTEAILASGIRRIVVGMVDPYHEVAGRGIQRLREAGCTVVVGIREDECRYVNRWFAHHVTTGRSYVLAKVATTIDGAVSAPIIDGRWITSAESRATVHALRAELDAVMTGIGTVVADDPALTVRDVNGRNPVRIVVDARLRIDANASIIATASDVRTIIVCDHNHAASAQALELRNRGAEVVGIDSGADGLLDLDALVRWTGSQGIASILLESGPRLLNVFIASGRVNELHMHVAPHLAPDGQRWFEGSVPTDFDVMSTRIVGGDVHVHYRTKDAR